MARAPKGQDLHATMVRILNINFHAKIVVDQCEKQINMKYDIYKMQTQGQTWFIEQRTQADTLHELTTYYNQVYVYIF